MSAVGAIGLGNMGGGISRTLLDRGWTLTVFDLDPAKVEPVAAAGAQVAGSPDELVEKSEAILLFLPMAPNHPALERVVLGEGGLVERMRPGACIIDCGNTSPTMTRRIAEALGERGVDFIDAPVSGGPQGAQAGTATAMVGGSDETVRRWSDLLGALGAGYEHFGDVGSGQMAKLCNNVLVAANLAAVSEVLIFAERNGIHLGRLHSTIARSAGGSWVLENYGREILSREGREAAVGPRLEYGRDRQLFWAMEIARDMDIPLPMTAQAYHQFMAARALGKHGSSEPVVEMLEDITGADVIFREVLETT